MKFTIRIIHKMDQEQLEQIRKILMDAAESINEAINRVAQVVQVEAEEIADLVRSEGDMPVEKAAAIVSRLDGLADKIRDFVSPTPPVEPPSGSVEPNP